MGLDGVEIIMEVEETFGCRIDGAAASEMQTVGDLYDYLVRIQAAKPSAADTNSQVCLSAATFFRLRRSLLARLGVARRYIRPSTPLDGLLPRTGRVSLWRDLSADLQWELPHLGQPAWLVHCSQALAMLCGSVVLYAVAISFGTVAAILPTIFVALICYGLFLQLAEPWAICPQQSFATVGGLALTVLARNYASICRAHDCWDPEDSWNRLREIIVRQLGVKPEEVTRDATWVNDLGLD